MKPILHIALQYLRTTYSNRTSVIFSLLMPLLFTFVLGNTIGGGSSNEPPRWQMALVDADQSTLSQALAARLQAHPNLAVTSLPAAELEARVASEEFAAGLLIPTGFGAALTAGQIPTLTFLANGVLLRPAQSIEQIVRAAAAETASINQAAATSVVVAELMGLFDQDVDRAAYLETGLAAAQAQWQSARPLVVQTTPVTLLNGDPIANGFDQSSPGMLVTFALVSILNGAIVLIIERQQGTLRRLLVMPLGKSGILAGKLLAIFAAALVQAAVLILAGQFLFGVNWGKTPLALVLMVLAFCFATTSLGMLIAGVARTYAQANALANVLMYSIAALGGAWWPIEITPTWMQRLAQITPTYWAMRGFQDIISRGLGVSAILPEVAVLAAFGLLFLTIGIWRFRYE